MNEITRHEYWLLLKQLKQEYDEQYTGYYEPTYTGYSDSFDKYVIEKHGIKIRFVDGYITSEVMIVDEAKYAWMLLKYK